MMDLKLKSPTLASSASAKTASKAGTIGRISTSGVKKPSLTKSFAKSV